MATPPSPAPVTELPSIPWSRRDPDACEARRQALFAMLAATYPDYVLSGRTTCSPT